MCLWNRKPTNISLKGKLILMNAVFTVLTLLIFYSAPGNMFSTLFTRNSPHTTANSEPASFKHTKFISSTEDESATFTGRKYKLVDIPQLFTEAGIVDNMTRETKTSIQLKIIWFNKPTWFGEGEEMCNRNMHRCYQGNCLITYDRSLLKEADAIIFDATTGSFPQTPPLTPTERDPNQVWILYGLESPFYYETKHFQRSQWRSCFNWTMTYRLDADIPNPYGILITNHNPPERNYKAIFRAKTKFAAWIVSNCNAYSKRNDFVRLLQKYVPVDIFGNCGTISCTRQSTECRDSVGKNYKFYLSFENSLCKDYITEKFFQYFPLDLITVQRGYSDYDALLPNETYINSAKFTTVQELASFMTRLAEDEDKFIRYLKLKDRYLSKGHSWIYCNSLCSICNKLHHLEKHKQSYYNIGSWLEDNTCSSASDIK